MPGDVFDHHDGVVGHETDGGGDASERHEIDRLAGNSQTEEHDRDRDRNRRDGDGGDLEIAQVDQQHEGREPHTDQDRVARAVDGGLDELGLVVGRRPPDVGRKKVPPLSEDIVDGGGDPEGARVRLADHADEDGGLRSALV